MTTVSVYEAKTQLSRLIARVEAGEEITISRSGKPVVRLARLDPPKPRELGQDEGVWEVPADFKDPLPEDMQRALEGYDD